MSHLSARGGSVHAASDDATVETTKEAMFDAHIAATMTCGQDGRTAEALPIDLALPFTSNHAARAGAAAA